MITCDTKQIALDIGQCPSRKSRVRGGTLGKGGRTEIFGFLVLPQAGMIHCKYISEGYRYSIGILPIYQQIL